MPDDILTAFALVLVIEGLLYALFPTAMRQALVMALAVAPDKLRAAGLIAAAIGVGLVWLLRG